MAETLYIRLGSQSDETIHWLIAEDSSYEIIASGELSSANKLHELTEKASQRRVVTFVTGADVSVKSLSIPAKSKKAILAAAPYMLEDNLAQDVDDLFFAYANLPANEQGENCFVAIVDKHKMSEWLTWLNKADINCSVLLPDFLALPLDDKNDTNGSVISLGKQILLRQSSWQGITVDASLWETVCRSLYPPALTSEDGAAYKLNAYSTISDSGISSVELIAMPEELPLALLAENAIKQRFNLLQGEYQVKQPSKNHFSHWRWAAGIVAVALLLNVTIKATQAYRLSDQIAAIDAQIIKTYKQTFPKTKKVRINTIKSQLKSKMSGVSSNAQNGTFLMMLEQLKPAFKAASDLKPQTLKYDGKKQEIRMQAEGENYQTFEKFSQFIKSSKMNLSQGSLNNKGDKVVGSLSITKGKGGS